MRRIILVVLLAGAAYCIADPPEWASKSKDYSKQESRIERIKRTVSQDADVALLLSNDYSAAQIAQACNGTANEQRFRRAVIKVLRFLAREYVAGLRED